MKGYLILEDGTVFEGECISETNEVISEFVFNTSMTGYLEVLTDPSYAGQSVVMTYPLIGNYGICLEDQESIEPHIAGFVVNELARVGSNFRKNIDLKDYLIEHHIPCIEGIDTRYLTKLIRSKGCMNGMITTTYHEDISELLPRIQQYSITKVVEETTCVEPYVEGKGDLRVALYDLGAKHNIVQSLVDRNIEVTVFPADTKAEVVINGNFDGIMLSNGPGDPSENVALIGEIKKLADSGIPIFAICLGHQLMALAHEFHTEKLKYGHHGSNHPVKDLRTDQVYITTQNHNYVITAGSIDPDVAKPWFVNVNDQTIEGIEYINKKIKTVQFHPEACAGPMDTNYLFDQFVEMMGGKKNA